MVLAFLTLAQFELCGFVGSWRVKGEGAPMRPMTLGATSIFDFISEIKLLPPGEEVGAHAEKLADFVDSVQQVGNSIILQGQVVPEQPVEGTGFQQLMITVLNDNRTGGLSAVHAEPGVGKSVAAAMALRNYTQKSAVTVLLRGDFTGNLQHFFGLRVRVKLRQLLWSCFVS